LIDSVDDTYAVTVNTSPTDTEVFDEVSDMFAEAKHTKGLNKNKLILPIKYFLKEYM
jgi:hypothetical protein